MLPARFLREKEISHWFSVPSAADSLHRVGALRPGVFPHLRQTLFCGEPLRWPATEAWQAAAQIAPDLVPDLVAGEHGARHEKAMKARNSGRGPPPCIGAG
jgi:non-ribosomal peptide synthetase component F